MGNNTSFTGSGYLTKINGILLVAYLRKQLTSIAQTFLFEINDTRTRQRVVAALTPVLEGVKTGNGISDYRIVCDETNNTAATIADNKLVIDVYINPYNTAETLVITIINTNTSEAFTG
jgi:phage tail sheath protein FI